MQITNSVAGAPAQVDRPVPSSCDPRTEAPVLHAIQANEATNDGAIEAAAAAERRYGRPRWMQREELLTRAAGIAWARAEIPTGLARREVGEPRTDHHDARQHISTNDYPSGIEPHELLLGSSSPAHWLDEDVSALSALGDGVLWHRDRAKSFQCKAEPTLGIVTVSRTSSQ